MSAIKRQKRQSATSSGSLKYKEKRGGSKRSGVTPANRMTITRHVPDSTQKNCCNVVANKGRRRDESGPLVLKENKTRERGFQTLPKGSIGKTRKEKNSDNSLTETTGSKPVVIGPVTLANSLKSNIKYQMRVKYPKVSAPVRKRIYGCTMILYSLFRIYEVARPKVSSNNTEKIFRSLLNTCIRACECVQNGGSWMSYFKYKICAFYSVNTSQPIPSLPIGLEDDKPGVLFGGILKRWLFQFSVRFPSRYESFVLSVLMSKKGMPRPGYFECKDQELKTFIALTTPRLRPTITINDYEITPVVVNKAIRRTVREIFRYKRFFWDRFELPYIMSKSATYNNTRTEMGTIGEVMDLIAEMQLEVMNLQATKVGCSLYNPFSVKYSREEREKEEKEMMEDYLGFVQSGEILVMDFSELKYAFRALWRRALSLAYDALTDTKCVALSEALKVRVITKGPPLLYFVLKPLQLFMWRTLKSFDCFLVDRPATVEEMWKLISKFPELQVNRNLGFLSADFKSATDNFFTEISETIADEFMNVMEHNGLFCEDDGFREMVKWSLTGHYLEDPRDASRMVRQENGQLMGSITSFVVLCIANAALTRHAQELYQRCVIPLDKLGALINGDDMLTVGEYELYSIWRQLGKAYGLEESVGKTYFGRSYMSLNSTTYKYWDNCPDDTEDLFDPIELFGGFRSLPTWTIEELQYVNLGNLLGKGRSNIVASVEREEFEACVDAGLLPEFGSEREKAIYFQNLNKNSKTIENENDAVFRLELCNRQRDLLKRCPTYLHDSVLKEFFYIHGNTLSRSKVPWFWPRWAGGLHLMRSGGYDDQIRNEVGKARLYFLRHPEQRRLPMKPYDDDWQTWKIAESLLRRFDIRTSCYKEFEFDKFELYKEFGYDNERYLDLSESNQSVMNQLVLYTIFKAAETNDTICNYVKCYGDALNIERRDLTRAQRKEEIKKYKKRLRDASPYGEIFRQLTDAKKSASAFQVEKLYARFACRIKSLKDCASVIPASDGCWEVEQPKPLYLVVEKDSIF